MTTTIDVHNYIKQRKKTFHLFPVLAIRSHLPKMGKDGKKTGKTCREWGENWKEGLKSRMKLGKT